MTSSPLTSQNLEAPEVPANPPTPDEDAAKKTQSGLQKWFGLKLAQYATLVKDQDALQAQQRRAWKAEEEQAFEELWGKPMPQSGETSGEDDNMIVVGDYNVDNSNHQDQRRSGSAIGSALKTAGLLAAGAATGGLATLGITAVGELLDREPAHVEQPYLDDSLDVGLGKIEDYLRENP